MFRFQDVEDPTEWFMVSFTLPHGVMGFDATELQVYSQFLSFVSELF